MEVSLLFGGAPALASEVVGFKTQSTLLAPRWTACTASRVWKCSTAVATSSFGGVSDAVLLRLWFTVVVAAEGSDGRTPRLCRSSFNDTYLAFGCLHGAADIYQLRERQRRF